MSHAEKCPVCFGKGKIKETLEWSVSPLKTCHGCSGKGWVEVSDSYPLYPQLSCSCYVKLGVGALTAGRIPCPVHG